MSDEVIDLVTSDEEDDTSIDSKNDDDDFVPAFLPVPATAQGASITDNATMLRRSTRTRRPTQTTVVTKPELCLSISDGDNDAFSEGRHSLDEEEQDAAGPWSGASKSANDTDKFTGETRTDATSSRPLDKVKLQKAYIRERLHGVKVRTFDLRRMPSKEVISTGRTIQKMGSAWSKSYWPPLREFLQNTMDHLHLLKDGRVNPALNVVRNDNSIQFICGTEPICTISTPSDDEVQIEQLYTFALPSRALDTGVPDTTKRGATSHAAGGFGDGFKTAAVALLASNDPKASLEWVFSTFGDTRITWTFEGSTRQAVGTFAKCSVLQVRIEKQTSGSSIAGLASVKPPASPGRDNVMHQIIKAKGIGSTFWKEAIPKMQMFWELKPQYLLSSKHDGGGDFIGNPMDHGLVGGKKGHPEGGVYVRGIWVRSAKLTGSIMSFNGNNAQVTGRDRNDVLEEDLVDAVASLFRRCSNKDLLRTLLTPLKGKTSGGSNSQSWLLKGRSSHFLNRVLEIQKEYILHQILRVPRGALFVSRKTTESTEPFIKWAAEFLKSRGAPLVPIENGANKYLFEEVNEYQLSEKCVQILNQDMKNNNKENRGSGSAGTDDGTPMLAVRELLKFMTGKSQPSTKVFFSPSVRVAFVHGKQMFLPQATLNRDLLVKVLNICQTYLDDGSGCTMDNENFSCLIQALFETISTGSRPLSLDDVKTTVKRATTVREGNRNFLAGNNSASQYDSVAARSGSEGVARMPEPLSPPSPVVVSEEETRSSTFEDVKRRINDITNLASDSGNRKRQRRQTKTSEEEVGFSSIIPESAFGRDDAGDDTCLRASSELRLVPVDEILGDGHLLCDEQTAASIGQWKPSRCKKVAELRDLLGQAISIIKRCIPSLTTLLGRVRHGYDSRNDSYEAFCDGTQIVVNFRTYMHRSTALATSDGTKLLHDLILMLTHELAHFLEPHDGHGPAWRDTHMKLVAEIMSKSMSSHQTGALATCMSCSSATT